MYLWVVCTDSMNWVLLLYCVLVQYPIGHAHLNANKIRVVLKLLRITDALIHWLLTNCNFVVSYTRRSNFDSSTVALSGLVWKHFPFQTIKFGCPCLQTCHRRFQTTRCFRNISLMVRRAELLIKCLSSSVRRQRCSATWSHAGF